MTYSSAPLRFAAALQNDRPISENIADAHLAEHLGYAEIWGNESGHGRGVFTELAAIASSTSSIGLGIGIVNPFHRHPSVIAMEAATLDELSRGRLRLGLGASQWNLRHLGEADARTARPYTATIEAVRIIRAMLHGTPSIESTVFEESARTRTLTLTRSGRTCPFTWGLSTRGCCGVRAPMPTGSSSAP